MRRQPGSCSASSLVMWHRSSAKTHINNKVISDGCRCPKANGKGNIYNKPLNWFQHIFIAVDTKMLISSHLCPKHLTSSHTILIYIYLINNENIYIKLVFGFLSLSSTWLYLYTFFYCLNLLFLIEELYYVENIFLIFLLLLMKCFVMQKCIYLAKCIIF